MTIMRRVVALGRKSIVMAGNEFVKEDETNIDDSRSYWLWTKDDL